MPYSVRSLASADEPLLWEMLMYAAHESAIEDVKENPDLSRYVQNFGRHGDVGVAAVSRSQMIGAAWLRLWQADDQGYGYVSDEIPELAISVHPSHRGKGVGTQLLAALVNDACVIVRFPAISLSIRADNPALRLYERIGFVPVPGSEVTNRIGTQSFSMIYRFG